MKFETVDLADPKYPELLRHIHNPPKCLNVWGAFPDFELHPPIAIVGSRKPTEYGGRNADEIASQLTEAGFTVISGLAYGIDSVAHRACVEKSGKTVAVLGCGLDKLYPEVHRKLAEDIVSLGGAVITEFEMGMAPLPQNFPARNRIISGLSLGVVVVEAAIDSGSLITASYALEQNREIFAVPGPAGHVNTAGTHRLIREGAALVERAQDVIDIIWNRLPEAWKKKNAGQFSNVDDKGQKILDNLGNKPLILDALVDVCGLPAEEIAAMLTKLECVGLVRQLPGRGYIKIKTHD